MRPASKNRSNASGNKYYATYVLLLLSIFSLKALKYFQ